MTLITYDEWKNTCRMIFNVSSKSWNKYLQTYPFSIIKKSDKDYLSSKKFFNKYISNDYLFMIPRMLNVPFNYLQKSNGSLRTTNLVNPLMYLYINAIGLHIYNRIKTKKDKSYYAGDYSNSDLKYRKSYEKYIINTNEAANKYNMYFKTDLSSFFDSIDVNMLFNLIEKQTEPKMDAKSLYIFQILFKYIGKERYPTINGNTGLSYIASKILLGYLDSLINNVLKENNYIDKNDFQIVRYVDDYYIFFNSSLPLNNNKENLNLIKTSIETIFFDTCSKLRLNINMSKTKCDFCKNFSSNLLKQSYEVYISNQQIDYSEFFNKKHLITFLQKLLENDNNYIDHLTIQNIANKTFITSKITSREIGLDVLNWYIYDNHLNLFQSNEIIVLLRQLVNDHFGVFQQMPRVFVQMLVKAHDDISIKSFLNKIFTKFKEQELTKYDILMVLEYLKQTHFAHIDLLKVIKGNQRDVYDFICLFCKSNFVHYINDEDNKFIDTKPNYKNDSTLNFMYLMYNYYDRNPSILPKYAYYKNYFDRYLAYLLSEANIIDTNKKGKIIFNKTYKKGIANDMYHKGIIDLDQMKKLIKSYEHRNKNIISHASAESFNDNNLKSNEYKNDINNLQNIINITEKYVIQNNH